ncbi:MAG: M23 family metallopeptidase [Firmicutes bacterium]|uniref:Stage IV sporulation protein FA n=1 Tax=Melghirimyces thermohalophilus TaxID=1236220 RepID=A0A1G6JMK9_9BACL|nr:M23 family metallopeptidase [Melghirimyces thermohalophilus]MDA8354155.1 M23 family metallopeptidase [Bacillota bacterium]SDC20002.1 stage IV sporulation protein FA [Melghirimyces thermohalophilus]
MREWSRGVSKRRQEQIHRIKRGKGEMGRKPRYSARRAAPSQERWDELPWNRPGNWMDERKKKKESRLLIQAFFAFFLLTGTYLVFQSDSSSAKQAQAFISEVMVRDYNFAGVAQWYEENIGGMPTILPAFQEKPSDDRDATSWIAPLKGEVVRPFTAEDRGMVIRAAENAPVVAAAEGWVVQAGREEGLGKVVVIRHGNGWETWYGWLGEIQVKEKDWVQPKQLLGEVAGEEGDPLLFFGMKQGGQFVDPAGVVPVE